MAAENLRERWRVRGILIAAAGFIAVGGVAGAFDAYYVAAVVAFFLLVAVVSAAMPAYRTGRRAWFDVKLATVLAVSFIVARFAFPHLDPVVLVLRTAAIDAFLLLHAVLLIGPWSWWQRWVMRLVTHRRHLGVTVFLLAELHATTVVRSYYNGQITEAFAAVFTFFGFTATYFLFFLAVTSNDRWQKHVKERTWQIVHLVMVLGYAAIAWMVLSKQPGLPWWTLALPAGTVIYGLLIARNPLTTRFIRRVWGWKQLHAMIYAVYVMVVVHVWVGVVQYQGRQLRSVFIALVTLVVGSHLLGVFLRWSGDRRARERVTTLGREVTEDGVRYVAVAREDEFHLRVGQKFFVAGQPIAVFQLSNRYLAVSNVCAHQKGPLYKSSFNAAEFLVCPWHSWEYSTKDGCGPPAFRKDCVPLYPTLTRDGYVYVSTQRTPLPPDMPAGRHGVPKPGRSAGDVP
ncbi:MAG: Rieske 2Fe-2S domain-containing protein [Patescibacteria group bacterium]|mgnify:CR=1 FL=1